ELDMAFGGGRDCFVDRAGFFACDRPGGEALGLLIGAKWKLQTHSERLVPYIKAGGGVAFLFWPSPYSNCVPPVAGLGGGVKYFVLPTVGVGGEMAAMLGPGLYGCGPYCTTSTLYAAWTIMGGVEWNF